MKHYYFINNEIYFQNKKMPPKKVELFHLDIDVENKKYTGYDKDGNFYKLNANEIPLIIEEINKKEGEQ